MTWNLAASQPTARRLAAPIVAMLVGAAALAGCSSSDGDGATDAPVDTTPPTAMAPESETSESTEAEDAGSEESTTTEAVPAGTNVDIGGLTVVVAAEAVVPEPESGVTLTEGSVYGLPGESFEELESVDVTNREVTSVDGEPVVVYLFGSDTLFDVGSATVKSTAEAALPAVVASLAQRSPNGRILVRGFTDSSGTAVGNQTLSEQRAASVAAWLTANGIDASRVETFGYGSTHPAAEESSEAGTALNRRIEIVVIG